MNYYTSQRLSPSIIRITDFTGVCCYLVEGKEKPACWIPATASATSVNMLKP